VSVYSNYEKFRKPVEGAMSLLTPCFSNFQCILHLATINNVIPQGKIIVALQYIFLGIDGFCGRRG
jgi:hypothetical protein